MLREERKAMSFQPSFSRKKDIMSFKLNKIKKEELQDLSKEEIRRRCLEIDMDYYFAIISSFNHLKIESILFILFVIVGFFYAKWLLLITAIITPLLFLVRGFTLGIAIGNLFEAKSFLLQKDE